MKTAWELLENESAIIDSLSEDPVSTRLLELGCLPLSEITLLQKNKWFKTATLIVGKKRVALRENEAKQIFLTTVDMRK